jgi:hypothetical protein
VHYVGRAWTVAHHTWLRSLTWTHAAEQHVVDDYLLVTLLPKRETDQ